MVTKEINIVVNKDKADKSLKEVKGEIKDVDNSSSKLTGTLDKMTGGAVSGFKTMKSGIGSAITSFKSLRIAIIGTGIGALIIGILAVKEAFTSSEEGQNKFAKILGVIGSITGNLSDLLSNLGMKIIEVFENPKQALKDFANLIKENIINRFVGILELIPNLGKAVKQLFEGDFSGASVTAGNAVAKVTLGVDNLSESIKNSALELKRFAEEVAEDARKSAKIADQRANADKLDRKLITERAEANRKIAELRFKTEQRDQFSAKERIKFLEEASQIQEDITNKEIVSAKLRLEARVEENKLSNSTKDDLLEEENLKAKVIDLETQKLSLNRRLQTQIQSTQKEVIALSNAERKIAQDKIDAEEKILKDKLDAEEKERIKQAELEAKTELQRLEKIASIQDEFKKKREDELAETELQKIELEKERKLKELEELKPLKDAELEALILFEQQKADVVKFFNQKIQDEKLKIEKETADKEKKLNEDVADAKKDIANRTASLLIELAGKGSKIGKGIAVAQTIRSGIEGVQNSYTTAQKSPITALFPAYPLVQAGLAGAFSALQVKKILSTSDTGGGGSSSGGADTSAPSFNLVEGTQQNQLAQSVQGINDKPLQAIVVASNVTTAQQANRNKIDDSSI